MRFPSVVSDEAIHALAEYYMRLVMNSVRTCFSTYGLAILLLLILLVLVFTTISFFNIASKRRQQCSEILDTPNNPVDGEEYKKYDYGVKTDQNMRSYQEDRYCIHNTTVNGKQLSFFGIFDGHGGCHASQYCANKLYQSILTAPSFPEDISEAITEGFLTIDQEYKVISSSLNNCISEGTTVCICLIYDGIIYLAHVGDSRAVIVSKDKKTYYSTHDHKPNRVDEKERILSKGGKVVLWGVWRVEGVLAVSRSIGDYELKDYVIATPEILTIPLESYDYVSAEHQPDTRDLITPEFFQSNAKPAYIVLASDGLWDTVKSTEIGEWIYEWSKEPNTSLTTICDQLIMTAKYRNSDDNMYTTVIVVAVDPFISTIKGSDPNNHESKQDYDSSSTEKKGDSSQNASSTQEYTLPKRDSTPNLDVYNVENAIEEEERIDDDNNVTIIENDEITNLKHRH